MHLGFESAHLKEYLNVNMLIKDKLKATAIHLLLSSFLALLCFMLVFFIIYPSPLAQATGVSGLFLIMLGVDVVLGPALTFIVYKKNKKTLKIDLLVIVLIQLSALCYGVYSMYQGRPVWIAYTVDRFELVRVNDIIGANQKYPTPWLGTKYISVETRVKTAKQQLEMMLEESQSGISPAQQPKYYRLFELKKFEIENKSKSLELLKQFNDNYSVEKILKQNPKADAYFPLKANAVDMTVLINKEKGEVIKIVDLRPWK